jgi:hypothetical protein
VRWTQRGNTVFLRLVDYSIRAEGTGPSPAPSSVEPIAATFPVEAEGKDGAVVVDVTRFFKQCRLSATAKTPDAPPLVPE